MNNHEIECRHMTAEELSETIRSSPEYDSDALAALCWMADMEEAWSEATGEDFEAVAMEAADKLGVEI